MSQESEIPIVGVTLKRWGAERHIVTTDRYTGKILDLNPGFCSSIHRHHEKMETFYVWSGIVRVET